MAKGANRTLALKVEADIKGTDKLKGVGKRLSDIGSTLTKSVTLPLVAAGVGLVALAENSRLVQTKLVQAFDNVGAAAWTNVDALNAQAQALEDATTFDDEAVNSVQTRLLTFGTITGQAFERATAASLDFATAMGVDSEAAASQLGKALADPVRGLSKLRRVGINFTADQERVIKALADTGDVAGAQAVILDEFEQRFGGMATAVADTAGGRMKQAFNALEDAGEAFGDVISPLIKDIAERVRDFAKWLRDLNPEIKTWIVRLGGVLAVVGPLLFVLGKLIGTIGSLTSSFKFLFIAAEAGQMSRFSKAFSGVSKAVIAIAPRLGAALTLMLGPIGLVVAAVGALAVAFATDFLGIRSATEAAVNDMALNFGDMGDTVHRLADESGRSFQEMKDTIKEAMEETGNSFEQTVERINAGLDAAGEALQSSSSAAHAWSDEQAAAYAALNGHVVSAMDGVVGAVIGGVDDAADEFGELPEKSADQLLANQFHLTDAIAQLIEFMNKALDPAQEVVEAQMFRASQAAAEGLASNNPLIRLKTQEMIDAASTVIENFNRDALNYGKAWSSSFAFGISEDQWKVQSAITGMAQAARKIMPSSEPKDPNSPWRGITKGWGLMDTFAKGLKNTSAVVNKTLASVFNTPSLSPIAVGAGAAPMPMSGSSGGVTINLTVNGDLTSDREAGIVGSVIRAWNVATGVQG